MTFNQYLSKHQYLVIPIRVASLLIIIGGAMLIVHANNVSHTKQVLTLAKSPTDSTATVCIGGTKGCSTTPVSVATPTKTPTESVPATTSHSDTQTTTPTITKTPVIIPPPVPNCFSDTYEETPVQQGLDSTYQQEVSSVESYIANNYIVSIVNDYIETTNSNNLTYYQNDLNANISPAGCAPFTLQQEPTLPLWSGGYWSP